jgi:phosphoglycolate phosphatase-like HAD superfamily hydrolase
VIFLKEPKGWLLFGYDIPEKPSRIRVRVWRQLKALGALYPQMSFCILPDSDAVRSHLMEIESTMVTYGPRLVLEAKATQASHLQTLIALFRKDADEEYRELAEECEEFLEEVKKNLRTGNVTQTEVFELEEALEGLERWFTKIKGRDFFGGKSRQTLVLLKRCRNALLDFSEKAEPKPLGHSPNRR